MQDLRLDGGPVAAALVANGSGDTDPRTLEVRLELGGSGGRLKGQCSGSTLTPVGGDLCSPQSALRGGLPASPSLHSWPRG